MRFNDCLPLGSTVNLTLSGQINTTGKTGIRVGFGRRASTSWDGIMPFQWSSDGSIWEDIDANTADGASDIWDTKFYDLPTGAENQSNLRFRFQFATTENINCTAPPNFRIDDFIVGANLDLPVHWLQFKAQVVGRQTYLTWTTAEEIENDHFDIERSTDGSRYESLAALKSQGNSRSPQAYAYTDQTPLRGTNYYRLRQVDTDGRYTYSPVVTAVMDGSSVRLSPTAATDVLRLTTNEPSKDDCTWQIFDTGGRLLQSGIWEAESVQHELSISTLPQGHYALRLTDGQSVPTVLRFQKM